MFDACAKEWGELTLKYQTYLLKLFFFLDRKNNQLSVKTLFGSWNVRLDFGTFRFVVKKRSRWKNTSLVFTGRIKKYNYYAIYNLRKELSSPNNKR